MAIWGSVGMGYIRLRACRRMDACMCARCTAKQAWPMDAASNKAAIAPLTMATGGIPRDLGGSAVLKVLRLRSTLTTTRKTTKKRRNRASCSRPSCCETKIGLLCPAPTTQQTTTRDLLVAELWRD